MVKTENLEAQPWINDLDSAMLPEPYRKLADVIGIKAVLKLADEFQGTNIYFPKLDGTIKMIRDKKILDDYQRGFHIKELARMYGLTETWVRTILTENKIDNNQLTLFDSVL